MEGKFVKGLFVGGVVVAAMMKNKDMLIKCRPTLEKIKEEFFHHGQDGQTEMQHEAWHDKYGVSGHKRRPRKYIQARSHRIVRAGL